MKKLESPHKENAIEYAIYNVNNNMYLFINNEFQHMYLQKNNPFYILYNDLCSFIRETHNLDNKYILDKAIELKNIVETYLENKGEL